MGHSRVERSDTSPHSIFPQQPFVEHSGSKNNRPHIQLQTTLSNSVGLTGPVHQWHRPEPLRTNTSPPDSPTRTRSYTVGAKDPKMLHESGAITPPPTPTKTHSKSTSASSLFSELNLARGNSVKSTTSRRREPSIDESEKPGSTHLLVFPHWLTDYKISDEKRPLGSGLWSDVYLAQPCVPKATASSEPPIPSVGSTMTPPMTPVKSRRSSILPPHIPQLPSAYAIKVPTSRPAKQVLSDEALVLSYLSRFPDVGSFSVPFYGQDIRNSALVLEAMDITLESWIQSELNTVSQASRSQKLASVFPTIALNLLNGLLWMQDLACTHADIKPSNILLSLGTNLLRVLYSDFSSATLSTLPTSTDSGTSAPLGGGTWDFLDPLLLVKSSNPPSPCAESDTWALAVTLLYLVIGASPFECAGSNIFRRREIIKQGTPVAYAAYGDEGPRNLARLKDLSQTLGFDARKWLEMVLKKDVAKRISLADWKAELVTVVTKSAVKI